MMIRSWLDKARWDKAPTLKDLTGFLYLLGGEDPKALGRLLNEHALPWQKASLLKQERDLLSFAGKKGPVWIVRQKKSPPAVSHQGLLEDSPYTYFRDTVGALVPSFKLQQLAQLSVEFSGTSREQQLGAFTGLEIASYHFRDLQDEKPLKGLPVLWVRVNRGQVDRGIVAQARARGGAVNLARHLVNLPPNELHPASYATLARALKAPGLSVEVWDAKRLAKEGMNLHLAVGRGAENQPCLVRLRWRPPGAKGGRKPVALVGKGITFDTGGLDIKPSSAMRLMKKDMGGSACVLGVMQWAAAVRYPAPLDAYLALAENAVDAAAFRPSDIVRARNGARVEIDNTDAEGRLVLADALDVAVTRKGDDEPDVVIDVATLTGAIKVALGADVAGLFSNDDALADSLSLAGQSAGDLSWRMPLVERYWPSLNSPFADFKNSADGFGGAITAALFLSRFVRNKSWAHLDIYAWSDKGLGAVSAGGGSGQGVQALIEWLEAR
ncbi:MAG: leucyl aminopeptidase family protein [Bdellovibrionaceae bacterium]|nr:leucyl aminopeptidase family protein [Pseudobdellovibrionaceae bacterium]